ncbi:MAG: hypothetical protein FJY65_10585 [Calditrichaeota bacterium]|nr:hypothetical protein [Calditrichota bacterium]
MGVIQDKRSMMMNDDDDDDRNKVDSSIVWEWIRGNIRTLDAVGGVKPFPDYPFLEEFVAAMCNRRILIVAKSRQMMATWTVAAVMLYQALFDRPGLYLFLSKGARDSNELVKRLRVIARHLPKEYQAEVKIKEGEASFSNGSRIISLPATEYAPRMHSPTGVFWDEMAFTERSEGIWAAVKPAVDSGGRFVGVSTPNGTDNMFHRLFSDNENGFGKLTLHYQQHPLRDEKWLKRAQKGLSEARWRQEYEIDFNVLAERVYSEFDPELHILPQPYIWRTGAGRTYRSIDFGYRHPYILWAQGLPGGELIIFDEWEGEDATVEEMMKAVRRIDSRHSIEEDAIEWTACDPAGAAVSDEGLSAVARLMRAGFKVQYRKSEVMTGVELVKTLLKDAAGRVRLKFAPNCRMTLEHIRHYRWKSKADTPAKDDGHDHSMDALRYLVVNLMDGRKPAWSGAKVMGVGW